LHSYGLLADSFRPEADLIALRTLLRHRAQLIEHRAPHIQHMQKALIQMNIQLSQALSDITGATGQRIIRSIVAGERDPEHLAAMRDYHCKKDEAEIAKALTGNWRAEHLFVLKQSLALYDDYTRQIQECDQEIEHTYAVIRPQPEAADQPEPELTAKPGQHCKNGPEAEQVRSHLLRICKVDLAAVIGIGASIAQTIISEIGTDMSRFPTEKHFCSWLGLAPHNDISGGKILKSYTLKTRNRAGQAFRRAAASVISSDSNFGAFYRRLKGRLGSMQALVATAHKMARIVYHMLKGQLSYEHIGADEYNQRFQERELRYLQRKASKLGFQLIPSTINAQAVS
jgi:transposase